MCTGILAERTRAGRAKTGRAKAGRYSLIWIGWQAGEAAQAHFVGVRQQVGRIGINPVRGCSLQFLAAVAP